MLLQAAPISTVTPSTCLQQYSHPRDTKTSGHTAHLGHGAPGGGVEAGMESSHTDSAQKHMHGAK